MRKILSICLLLILVTGPFANAAERPNILVAIADDWSFGHASAYGCKWVNTPNFDRIAKEGLLFTHAFTPNAKCAPSRATILTGRYSWQLEEAGNHFCEFPPHFGSYVERLAADGYFAGYTGKGWGPGRANDVNGKKRAITGRAYSKHRAEPATKKISRNDYAKNFASFLSDVPDNKPWVFWYGTTEPHRGYEFKSGVRLGKKLSDIDRIPAYWPQTDTTRHDMLDYAIEVEHYDLHLGRILESLEKAGQLDNTLIVATSDHGMPFPRVKGQAYAASNHIPLAIRWPQGIKKTGRVVADFVNFTDLAPTFLEAANIKEAGPIMQDTSGHSLFDIFSSDQSGVVNSKRDHVIVGKERHDIGRPKNAGYPIRGIREGDWLYLRNYEPTRWPAGNPETGYLNCDGSPTKTSILNLRRTNADQQYWILNFGLRPKEELFNVKADPDCVSNLVNSPKHAELLKRLTQRMESRLKSQGDPRMAGNGTIFDNYQYANDNSNNFYERYMAGEKMRAGWVSESDFEAGPIDQ